MTIDQEVFQIYFLSHFINVVMSETYTTGKKNMSPQKKSHEMAMEARTKLISTPADMTEKFPQLDMFMFSPLGLLLNLHQPAKKIIVQNTRFLKLTRVCSQIPYL